MTSYSYFVGENIFWTKDGLKEAKELKPSDAILGIDEAGSPSWEKVSCDQINLKDDLCNLILDGAEVTLSASCEVVTPKKPVVAKELAYGTFVETFRRQDFIINEIHGKKQTLDLEGTHIRMTKELAYFLGLAYRHLNGIQEKLVIKFPRRERERTTKILPKALKDAMKQIGCNQKPVIELEEGSLWSWFIIKCDPILTLVETTYQHGRTAPLAIRASNWGVIAHYVKGLIDIMGITSTDGVHIRLEMSPDEQEMRKFFYSVLLIFGINCATRLDSPYCPFNNIIEIGVSQLNQIDILGTKFMPSRRRVRGLFYSKGPIYKIESTKMNWSPVIGAVVLAPSKL